MSQEIEIISESQVSDHVVSQRKDKVVKRRTSFNVNFKHKVMFYLNDSHSINNCATKFEIDRRLISRWKMSQKYYRQ